MVRNSPCSTKSATRKSHTNNENRMNLSSPVPSSPRRYLSRAGRSPMSPSVGLFGPSQPITSVKSTASPLNVSHLSLINKSVLGDVQNQSLLGNDFSPTRRLANLPQSKSNTPLPRVHRHHESRPYLDSSYQAQSTSPKHYPTHQPKYEGVGILPMVRLNQKNCLHSPNSPLSSPVMIKVAPPDILKPLPPVFLTVPSSREASADSEVSCPSTSTQSVLNALREKRKRTSPQDEDEVSSPAPSIQDNKRRRMSIPSESNEVASNSDETSASGMKRPSPDEPNEEEEEAESKRVRKYSSSSQATSIISTGSSVRNSIEASFSSSRRWLEKQRNSNTSRSNSVLGDDRRGRSIERASCGTRSRSSSRIRADIIDDTKRVTESDLLSSNACTPLASLSGRSTPASLSQDEMSDSPNSSMRRRPLLLKKKNLLHSDVADSFSQVPQLRYTLTAEEIELDRQAERERVLGTLDEVEEALKQEKKEKLEAKLEKKVQETPVSSTTPTAVATITAVTTVAATKSDATTSAASSLSLTSSLKSTTGFSMPGSKSNPAATSTATFVAPQPTLATPAAKPSAAAANPLLVKPSFSAPEQPTPSSAAASTVSSSTFSFGTLTGSSSAPALSAAPSLPKVATAPSSLNTITQVATATTAASAPFTFGQNLAAAPTLSFGQSVSSTNTTTASSKAATPFQFGLSSSATTVSSSLTAAPAATTSISSSPFTFGQNTAAEPPKSAATSAGLNFPGASITFGSVAPTSTSASSATFAFGKSDTKKTESAATFTFGKTDAPPSQFKMPGTQKSDASVVPSNTFAFGNKPAAQPDATATKSVFTFGQTEAKKPESAFSAPGSKPFNASVTSATSTPFGATSSSTSTPFGAFGATQSTTTTPFGATPAATQANPFGVTPAPSQSTPFNSSQATPFGSATTTTAQSKPFTFGATTSAPQSAFGAANAPSVFSSNATTKAPNVNPFGSTSSAFGAANTNATPFGAANNASTPAFGSVGSSQPAPAFGGSAPSAFAPATTAAAPNANPFGVAANTQSKPAFGAAPQTNGFNFGAASNATKPAEGVFQFGASNAAKPADSGFQFGAGSTAAPFSFGASSTPSINRTASAPNFGVSPIPSQDGGFSIGANPASRRPMARATRRRPVKK